MNNQLPKVNISKATLKGAIANNLPKSMDDMVKKQVLVEFEFPEVSAFFNRQGRPSLVMTEWFVFGLIPIRKRFFVHCVEGLYFLSRTETRALYFNGVFEAAKAAEKALKLYESGNAHKNFVLNY